MLVRQSSLIWLTSNSPAYLYRFLEVLAPSDC